MKIGHTLGYRKNLFNTTMVLSITTSIIILVGLAVSSGVFVMVFQPNEYWEEQKIINEFKAKNQEINSKRVQIITSYKLGEVSKEECINEMKILLDEAKTYLEEVEKEISFLNVSHNFKNANQLILKIEADIKFLEEL